MDILDVPITEEDTSHGSEEPFPSPDVNPAVSSVNETAAGGTGSRIGDVPPEVPGEAKDFVQSVTEVMQDVGETLGDMSKALTDSLGSVGNTIGEAMGEVSSTMGAALGDVSHASVEPILGSTTVGIIKEQLARGVALLTGTADDTSTEESTPTELQGNERELKGQSEFKSSSKIETEGFLNPPKIGGNENLLGGADTLTGVDRSH